MTAPEHARVWGRVSDEMSKQVERTTNVEVKVISAMFANFASRIAQAYAEMSAGKL